MGENGVFTVRTSRLDPDYIVPIHTEARDWFANSFENVVLVDEGRPFEVI
jgi:mRNA degradation ribonuclease J1/J2